MTITSIKETFSKKAFFMETSVTEPLKFSEMLTLNLMLDPNICDPKGAPTNWYQSTPNGLKQAHEHILEQHTQLVGHLTN